VEGAGKILRYLDKYYPSYPMKINPAGMALIKESEGLRLNAYIDAVGIPTIGYGHTDGVKMGTTITVQAAIDLLESDVKYFEDGVSAWTEQMGVALNENEFAACVSLAYNIGLAAFTSSTVAQKLISNDRLLAANAFLMWVRGDGEVLPGLERRRKAERELFLAKVIMNDTANFTIGFRESSWLKTRPVQSSELKAGEMIALSKGARLNVAAVQMQKENRHHLITLGKVDGKQLTYLGRNTLWVFAADVVVHKGGKIYENNPIDSVGGGGGIELFIPGLGNVSSLTPIIPKSEGGGFLTWGMATHGGTRIPTGYHRENIRAIARRFEVEVRPVLEAHTKSRINITSWYRPEPFNAAAGGVSNSTHLTGGALDFWVDPLSSREVFKIFDTRWVGGLGYYANGISHVDIGADRRWEL
jgi:lysozyme